MTEVYHIETYHEKEMKELNFLCIMLKDRQTYFKNLTVLTP